MSDDAPTGAQSAGSAKELLQMMPQAFQAEEAGDMEAVYQFDITGDEEFSAHLKIAGGKAEYFDGPAEAPDVTVSSPADVWLGISRGEINPTMAFMSGQFTAKGDMNLLMRLGNLFKS